GPHIARAIADQQVVHAFAVLYRDSLVVNLDLLVGFEVVPNHHFLFAPDQRGADFHRGKPVHVDMGYHVAREVDRQERDVDQIVEVLFTRGNDSFRFLLDDVVHDREIMRGKVPNHVDVVLEQSQVHAHRVVIEQVAERAFVHQLADLAHSAGEQEGVVHHHLKTLAGGQFD